MDFANLYRCRSETLDALLLDLSDIERLFAVILDIGHYDSIVFSFSVFRDLYVYIIADIVSVTGISLCDISVLCPHVCLALSFGGEGQLRWYAFFGAAVGGGVTLCLIRLICTPFRRKKQE